MRKIILVIIVSLISTVFFGCALDTAKNTASGENAKNTEIAETGTNSGANKSKEPSTQPPVSGEKIEKPSEVKFEPGALPSGWKKVDDNIEKSAEFDTEDGVLKLKIPGGTDFFGATRNAPHLLKPISGDFEIETKVKFEPKTGYQGAGIFVLSDDKNYLRFERGFGGIDGGESGIRFDKSVGGDYSAISGTADNPTESPEVELKLVRKDKEFTAFMRENIDGEWKEVGTFSSDYAETVQVGIIGVSTTDEITAEFAYIRIMPV